MIGTRGVPARYGGFETAVEEIGRRLVERGQEVTVYCRGDGDPGARDYLGMRLVHLPAVHARSLETLSHTAASVAHLWRAGGHDVARNLAARGERQRRLDLVLALDEEPVDEVHAGGPHRDHDLAGARGGVGPLLHHQLVDRGELVADHGAHAGEHRRVAGRAAEQRVRHGATMSPCRTTQAA